MQCEYIVLLPSIYYYSCILLQQPKVQDLYNYYIVARDCQLAFKAGCIYTSFAGIAAGLSHIHGKGILHNDLKADNVALSDCLPASNEAPVPRLWPTIVDFGKACPSEKGKMYVLGSRQKEMYRSRFSHIAPDLVDGIVLKKGSESSLVSESDMLPASLWSGTEPPPDWTVSSQSGRGCMDGSTASNAEITVLHSDRLAATLSLCGKKVNLV